MNKTFKKSNSCSTLFLTVCLILSTFIFFSGCDQLDNRSIESIVPIDRACNAGLLLKLSITTDDYGHETSWKIKQIDTTWTKFGPAKGTQYKNNQTYQEEICVPEAGKYRVTIKDSAGDGMCCDYGNGSFKIYRGDTLLHQGGKFADLLGIVAEMEPTTAPPDPDPVSVVAVYEHKNFEGYRVDLNVRPYDMKDLIALGSPNDSISSIKIAEGYKVTIYQHINYGGKSHILTGDVNDLGSLDFDETITSMIVKKVGTDPEPSNHVFKLEIMTDKNASDTSWKLFNDQNVIVGEGPDTSYANNKLYSETVPVSNGNYRLEIYDAYGDGLGTGAYVKCYLDDKDFFWGRYWFDDPDQPYKLKHFSDIGIVKFRAGPDGQVLTEREQGYLDEHNKQRKIAHEGAGLKYVPLRWSHEVAIHAQAWAEKLAADDCKLVHEQNTGMGENLAARTGTAAPRPIDGVVNSWVNSEGHYYQLKWRASHYLGCGEAYGDKCSVQACRFVTHGNCNGYDNWTKDYTSCTSVCPPEGCYVE